MESSVLARKLAPYWAGTFYPLRNDSQTRDIVADYLAGSSNEGIDRATKVLQDWEAGGRQTSVAVVAEQMIEASRN